MTRRWLFILLSTALCARSHPQGLNGLAGTATDSEGLGPTVEQVSPRADQKLPGKAWGMGSLTVPLPVKRSRVSAHLVPGKREAGDAGNDPADPLVLPIEHREVPRLVKREGDSRVSSASLIPRSDTAYYTTLNFGNPPQEIRVLVDTGSSELWINAVCATSGSADEQQFCNSEVGRYDSNRSSTAAATGEKSAIRYGSGSVNFTYFTDNMGLANSRPMEGVKFGVATSSRGISSGILGMAAGKGVTTKYDNFVDQLANQGRTPDRSYFMALGLKGEGAGVMVPGGVDTSKFVGKLKPQSIIPPAQSPDGVPRFWVRLRSISHTAPGQSRSTGMGNSSMAVVLDTGSTLALLPPPVVNAMAAVLDAGEADQTGLRRVSCAKAEQAGSFNFAFKDVTIRVTHQEFIRQQTVTSNGRSTKLCYLGVMESPSNSLALLGDTFLRSASAVFDIDGNNVYLAQYANCGRSPRSAQSSELANISGECRQEDLPPNARLATENGENEGTELNGAIDGQSVAGRRLAASTKGLTAAVGLALILVLRP